LKNGKNLSVLEFNGSGAEPHHVYGNHKTLIEAIGVLLDHWKILFQISTENHRQGVAYWTFSRGLNHLMQARKHFKILRRLELMDSSAQQKTEKENLKSETIIPRYTLTTEKAMR
jgi:hypothetical protein